MRNLDRNRRGAAALLLLAAVLALTTCARPQPKPAEPRAAVTPAHVAEDDMAVVAWDFPQAGGVYVNGAGRVIKESEKTADGITAGVQEPYEPKGQLVVKPAEAANPYDLFPVVNYTVSEAALGDAAKESRTASVTVHRRATPTVALELQQKGAGVILDVRDARFFAASDNIPGAINIPLPELERRAGELPQDKTIIVTYVAGNPDGEREAWEAVRVLTKTDRRATVLWGGIEAWWRDVTNRKRGR
jgi:rhodanese-related sulfurtransferase